MIFPREKKRRERLTAEGLKNLAANDYELAWRNFESVLFLDEDDPVANTLGAACLFNLGRFDEAEVLARRGVQLTPQLATAHYYLALLLIAKEKYDEAESELWEAIVLEPQNADFRLVLGRLLFIGEREAEAREQLARCVELSPDNAEAHFLLGLSLLRSGRVWEAKDKFDKSVALHPENEGALTFDGLLWMARAEDLLTTPPKLQGYRHAADLLRKAIELNPQNEFAREWLRLAQEAIERTSKPIGSPRPLDPWYQTLLKQFAVWVGLAGLSIGMFALAVWLDESKTADFWVVVLFIFAFEMLAFGLMLYLRRDFSALPPTIVSFVERVTDRKISPMDTQVKS